MVDRLRALGIEDEAVLGAFGAVPRHRFVGSALATQAYEDTSLPIGLGQTISKPSVVARMLVLLGATPACPEVGLRPHRIGGKNPDRRDPVGRQVGRDRGARPHSALQNQQVDGLGHPVGEGGRRQLDTFAGAVVVVGQAGAGGVAGQGLPQVFGGRGHAS